MLQVIKVLKDKVGTKQGAHNVGHRLDESKYVEYSAELADALQQKIVKFEALEKPPLPDFQHADTDLPA